MVDNLRPKMIIKEGERERETETETEKEKWMPSNLGLRSAMKR